MRVSDIVENKDKVLPDYLYDQEASGVVLILDSKWTKRQVYDEAVKVLDKHGDMPAIAVPPSVWELMDLNETARRSLLRQLDTKTKLADIYAGQIMKLEAEIEAKKKEKGVDIAAGGESKREEGGDTVDQNATKTAKGIWVPRPETTDNSKRVSKIGDVTHDARIGTGGTALPGLSSAGGSPNKHDR